MMTHFHRAAVALTATFLAASPLWAGPQYRTPASAGLVVRTAAGDENLLPRHHNGAEFQNQQKHTGGGGNSK